MNELLKISGAIYDETRIAILSFLLKHGECCVCELAMSLNLGQSRISRHLRLLQDAGLIVANRHGKWVYYSVTCEPNELKGAIFNSITSLELQLPEKIDAYKIEKSKKNEKYSNTIHR